MTYWLNIAPNFGKASCKHKFCTVMYTSVCVLNKRKFFSVAYKIPNLLNVCYD